MSSLSDTIKKEYGIEITEDNYMEVLLKEFEDDKGYYQYFANYYDANKTKLDLNWACTMFLFMEANENKAVEKIEKLRGKLRKYPENAYVCSWIGDVYCRYYGDLFKAKKYNLEALRLNPTDSRTFYEMGYVYNLLGRFDKSKDFYIKALKDADLIDNSSELKARCYFNIAVHETNMNKNYKKAMNLVESALKEMPDYPQAQEILPMLRKKSSFWGVGKK